LLELDFESDHVVSLHAFAFDLGYFTVAQPMLASGTQQFADDATGGGYWQPDAVALAKLRHDIDRKPHKIKAVLTDAGVRRAFLGDVQDNEKKAVNAFVNLASNQANALKRNPKVSARHQTFYLDRTCRIPG
jgi:hypothetical protein